MEAIGGTLGAPYMDDGRTRAYFGRRHLTEDAEVPERIARERVPAEIHMGGDLKRELAYGNHRSAAKYGGEVLPKAAANVALVGL